MSQKHRLRTLGDRILIFGFVLYAVAIVLGDVAEAKRWKEAGSRKP